MSSPGISPSSEGPPEGTYPARHRPSVSSNQYDQEKLRCPSGILRGSFELAIDSALPAGATHNVAFLDPPMAKHHRFGRIAPPYGAGRSAFDPEHPQDQQHHTDEEPLVFTKRPTLSSGRSSFSCSTCGRSAPISPVSDGVGGTPPLCRSETDLSDAAPPAGPSIRFSCNHGRTASPSHLSDQDCSAHAQPDDSQAAQHVSLLTAALLASNESSHNKSQQVTSPQGGCGILKRDAQSRSVSILSAGARGYDATETEPETTSKPDQNRPVGKPRFIEPEKPVRSTARRDSLPPLHRPAHRLSASPEQYVPERPTSASPPIVSPLQPTLRSLDSIASPSSEQTLGELPPAADGVLHHRQHTQSNSAATPHSPPARKRALTFQDADEVRQRAANKEAPASRNLAAGHSKTQTSVGVFQPTAVKLHTRDPIYLASAQDRWHGASSGSDFEGARKVAEQSDNSKAKLQSSDLQHRSSGTSPGGTTGPPDAQPAVQRQLTFAASPHELKVSRRPSQRMRLQRTSRSPSSSDEEGPYVDAVAAQGSVRGSRLTTKPRRSASSSFRRQEASAKRPHRVGSPAPRRLGGSEVGGRGAGQGRPRSPAPRGKVLIPESFGSVYSDEVADDLDYDEDDEDDDEEDSDEAEADDDDNIDDWSGRRKGRHTQRSSPHASGNFASRNASTRQAAASTSPHLVAGDEIVRTSSPHPSVDSESHPAAFSHSDFEEESESAEREAQDEEDGSHSTKEGYYSPSSMENSYARDRSRSAHTTFSSLSNSPLPFARHRLPSTAVSDGEACSSYPRRTSFGPALRSRERGSMSPHPTGDSRPDISRFRSHLRFANAWAAQGRSRSSGTPGATHGKGAQEVGQLESPTATLSPPAFSTRSLSSSAVARCAPSLETSADCAQAHITEASGSVGANTSPLLDPSPRRRESEQRHAQHTGVARSPDAFTALRSCLETAFAADEALGRQFDEYDSRRVRGPGAETSQAAGPFDNQSILLHSHPHSTGLSHPYHPNVRRPWFTALSSPGVLSPTRAAADWHPSQCKESQGVEPREHFSPVEVSSRHASALGLGPPVQIDSDVDIGEAVVQRRKQ